MGNNNSSKEPGVETPLLRDQKRNGQLLSVSQQPVSSIPDNSQIQHIPDDSQAQRVPGSNGCVAHVKKFINRWSIFYVLCFLSGQYINFEILKPTSSKATWKKVVSVAALIVFAGHFIVKVGYVATAVAVEVYTIGNISYTENLTENDSTVLHVCRLPHEHWKFTTAITISTFAAFVSYSLMTFCVLIPVNSIRSCPIRCCSADDDGSKEGCCIEYRRALKISTLSAFNDDENLSTIQLRYFFANYAVVILLFISSSISSIYYANSKYSNGYCSMNAWYLAMIVLHLVSQFCAIHSCFIFSKIIYKVTNKLQCLVEDMKHVNSCQINDDSEMVKKLDSLLEEEKDEEKRKELSHIRSLLKSTRDDEVNRGCYYWLQKMNQSYVKQVNPMLKLFGYWFIFHWGFFALTTMLLSGFIAQIIIEFIHHFKTVDSFLPYGKADTKTTYVLYVVFFTLVDAYLFLYPCFRAAAIGAAHAKFISTISNKQWTNIPLSIQTSFVQYLISENFAFQVPLFCANIAFGFNWVYVSFFIAILGAYMKF